MILADENICHNIIAALRKSGIEVYSIYESNRGMQDEDILVFSKNPERVIITEDKDFGEWVFAHHYKSVSIILLRYQFPETDKMIKVLVDLLQKKNEDLINAFTTITIEKIRIRKLK